MVKSLVGEFARRIPDFVDRDDLQSAGLLALVLASRSYQDDRGVPFSAYASMRIRGALRDALRSLDWAPRSVRRRAREVEDARRRLSASTGDHPDDAAVAADLGMTVAAVRDAVAHADRARVASLQAVDHDGADLLASEWLGPEDAVMSAERAAFVAAAMAELPHRLRVVVDGYYLRGRDGADLAAELGISRSRVYQLCGEAIVLMRIALDQLYLARTGTQLDKPGVVARRRRAYVDAVQDRYLTDRRRPLARSDASRPARVGTG